MKKSLKQKLLKSVSVIVLAIMVLSINSLNVSAGSVYPYPIGSRDDNFTKCKTRLYHNSIRNKPISTTYAAEITYDYNGK